MEKVNLSITVEKETLEKAISIYLTQVVSVQGIPFPLTLD